MKYDIKCDCCGKFIAYDKIGSSCFVPDSEVSYEELSYRCKTCTEKYGTPTPNQLGMNLSVCCLTH